MKAVRSTGYWEMCQVSFNGVCSDLIRCTRYMYEDIWRTTIKTQPRREERSFLQDDSNAHWRYATEIIEQRVMRAHPRGMPRTRHRW